MKAIADTSRTAPGDTGLVEDQMRALENKYGKVFLAGEQK